MPSLEPLNQWLENVKVLHTHLLGSGIDEALAEIAHLVETYALVGRSFSWLKNNV